MIELVDEIRIGSTEVVVSRLGLGTAPLAGLYAPVREPEALAVVDRALAAGVTYFDTAPHYGAGLAEMRLGKALAGLDQDSITISSKVGRIVDEVGKACHFDFSRDGTLASIEASLGRLGRDRLDIVLVHDPDDHREQAVRTCLPTLLELRSQGVVGAVGVGMNQSAMLTTFLHEFDLDVVLVAGRYTMLDAAAGVDLLPVAQANGTSVIVGGVFNSGVLADPGSGAHFDYLPASTGLVTKAKQIEKLARGHGSTLLAVALWFPLRDERVSSIVVGIASVQELAADVAALHAPPSEALWEALAADGLMPCGALGGGAR